MNAGNGEKLVDYKFSEIQADFKEVKRDLKEMKDTLSRFGERIGKNESRIDVIYWLVPLAVIITGIVVRLIPAFGGVK